MSKLEIRAIIFDLGGVVLDIDYNLTVQAFQALGYENFDEQYSQMRQSGLFDKLECGQISPDDFRAELKRSLPSASEDQLTDAWNAIILDFPEGRLDYIQQVKAKLPVFLLSNTNQIHLECYNEVLRKSTGSTSMDAYFNKVYLSHEIGLRKPDPEAFQLILEEQGLKASSTLFIDDSPQHIASANKLGLQTIHLQSIHDLEQELGALLA